MAYAVDWIGKVVSIPTSDLTLVSGTHYSLSMADFLGEIRRLESAFDEGLWAPQILVHTNSKPNFAGASYAGFDEIINGYTIQITGVATRVDVVGSNNNLVDVLIPTGVSVVPSNSAGLQLVATGSGLDAGQDAKLTTVHSLLSAIEGDFDHAEAMRILLAALAGKASVSGNTVNFRDLADTKNRITATTDGTGGRTSVTLDGS